VKILERGHVARDIMSIILATFERRASVRGTSRRRSRHAGSENAAYRNGRKIRKGEVLAYGRHLLDYSAKMMSATLAEIPEGVYRAEDFLDDDGITDQPQRIAVTIRIHRRKAEVDFTGSAPQCAGSVNAVAAITQSAVFYVFRCLLDDQVPATSG